VILARIKGGEERYFLVFLAGYINYVKKPTWPSSESGEVVIHAPTGLKTPDDPRRGQKELKGEIPISGLFLTKDKTHE